MWGNYQKIVQCSTNGQLLPLLGFGGWQSDQKCFEKTTKIAQI
jgi:hypothetical protein